MEAAIVIIIPAIAAVDIVFMFKNSENFHILLFCTIASRASIFHPLHAMYVLMRLFLFLLLTLMFTLVNVHRQMIARIYYIWLHSWYAIYIQIFTGVPFLSLFHHTPFELCEFYDII